MPVQERYFPIVCTEDHRQRAQKINIACLMPWEASPRPGTYVIDPQFPGTTGDRWKDYAFCSLIFDAQPRDRRGLARDARGGPRGARHAAFRSRL